MRIREFIGHFPDVEIHPEVVAAADYLESRGQKFMIDFGYLDAEVKARQEFEKDWPFYEFIQ